MELREGRNHSWKASRCQIHKWQPFRTHRLTFLTTPLMSKFISWFFFMLDNHRHLLNAKCKLSKHQVYIIEFLIFMLKYPTWWQLCYLHRSVVYVVGIFNSWVHNTFIPVFSVSSIGFHSYSWIQIKLTTGPCFKKTLDM